MDKVEKKVNFAKSGAGNYTPRVNVPMSWIKDMDISKDDNDVIMNYDKDKKEVIIKKLTK